MSTQAISHLLLFPFFSLLLGFPKTGSDKQSAAQGHIAAGQLSPPPGFDCDQFYLTYGQGAGLFGAYTNEANMTAAGALGFTMNGSGFNSSDNFIYTIGGPSSGYKIIRLHSDGSFDDLGPIGLSAFFTGNLVVGSFDGGGLLYAKDGNSNSVAIIDVENLTFSIVNPNGTFTAKDWAYNGNDGAFYGVDGGALHRYDPGSNEVTIVPLTGIEPGETGPYGAAWMAGDGYLYVANNNSGNIYRIDLLRNEAHFVLQGEQQSGTDGASCPSALPQFPVVYAISDTFCISSAGSGYAVHANDGTHLTDLNYQTFTILEQPNSGTISYDNATGMLSYFPGGAPVSDKLKYHICSNGPVVVCDYAFVYFRPAPAVSFDQFGPFCEGSSSFPLPASSNEGLTGSWSPSFVNTANPGIVTYTFTHQGPDCAITYTTDIEVTPALEIQFAPFGPFCQNQTPDALPAQSLEGFSGVWNPAAISTTAPGSFTFTFTPDDPCATAADISIVVQPVIAPTFEPIGPLCLNQTPPVLPAASLEGLSGNWSPALIQTSLPGTRSYLFTPDGCGETATLEITVPAPLEMEQTSFQCAADLQTFDLEVMITGGSGNYANVTAENFALLNTGSGAYTIQGIPSGDSVLLTIADGSGCEESFFTSPQNCNCPEITNPTGATDQAFCSGEPIPSFSVDDPGNGMAVKWFAVPLGGAPLAEGPVFSPAQPGIFYAELTDVASGCSGSRTKVTLKENPLPQVDAGPDITLSCDASGSLLSGSAGGGELSFRWEPAAAISSGGNTAQAGVQAPGKFYFIATLTQTGCMQSDSTVVFPADTLSFSFEAEPVQCAGDANGSILFLPVSGGKSPYRYSINGGQSFGEHPLFSDLEAGSYLLVVKDAQNCAAQSDAMVESPKPFSLNLSAAAAGTEYSLNATTDLAPPDIQSIEWSPAEGLSCTDCLNPRASPVVETMYYLLIRSKDGCTTVDSISILIEIAKNIYAPTAFSPNGDGQNDVFNLFTASAVDARIHSMSIFDRWGNLVFSKEDFLPNDLGSGWDGSFRGQLLDPGVFVFYAEIIINETDTEMIKGDIVLMH